MLKADLSQLTVKIIDYQDPWQEIKNSALWTIGKKSTKYPTAQWKTDILAAEHSPIRQGQLLIEIENCPQFVIGHLVRHHVGVTPFVQSLRSDRATYDEVPNRYTLQNVRFWINYQAVIDISKKRLCQCASFETRYVWQKILDAIAEYEPELVELCVPTCVYRGFCPEKFERNCKYSCTEAYISRVIRYRKYIEGE